MTLLKIRQQDKTNYELMRLVATARSLKNLRRFRPHCWLQLPLLPTCHLTSFLTFLLRNLKSQKRVESLTKGVVFWYLLFGVFTYLKAM